MLRHRPHHRAGGLVRSTQSRLRRPLFITQILSLKIMYRNISDKYQVLFFSLLNISVRDSHWIHIHIISVSDTSPIRIREQFMPMRASEIPSLQIKKYNRRPQQKKTLQKMNLVSNRTTPSKREQVLGSNCCFPSKHESKGRERRFL